MDWKQSLKLEKAEVLGLDIGSSEVKLIQLRKNNRGYAVIAAGVVDIAASEDNKNRREVNTVKAIRKCLESSAIQARLAVCSVCGPEVAVRHFKFPSLPPEEIEGAVLLEAAQVCPFNIDDGAVDYQLISNGKDNVSGVLVAATNKLIKSKVQLAEKASLDCVLMDVDGLALLNCHSEYRKTRTGRTTTAILNVGGAYTTLAIMGDNNWPFIRDMAYAGNDIVRQIAIENDMSTERTRRILFGCENPTEPSITLCESLEKACQKLISDVTETLRYYTAQEKAPIAEKIFVCGDFALVKGFVELLDSQLPAKAVLWNPFDKIRCDGGRPCEDILQKDGPAMAVAAGLAMREI